MSPKSRIWIRRTVDAVVVIGLTALIVDLMLNRKKDPPHSEFAAQVNLVPIENMAVQHLGRVRSFSSMAASFMDSITHGKSVAGQSDVFTYIDMMLSPAAYEQAAAIQVSKKLIREEIATPLRALGTVPEEEIESFMATGMISKTLLNLPPVLQKLREMERDAIRTAGPVNEINNAIGSMRPEILAQNWQFIPPTSGNRQDAWHDPTEAGLLTFIPMSDMLLGNLNLPNVPPEAKTATNQAWSSFVSLWRTGDAEGVSAAAEKLAAAASAIAPDIYPDSARIKLENFYTKWDYFTWTWMLYLVASLLLLIAAIYRWSWARWTGLTMLLFAFGWHTASVSIRWYLAGRVPNANMFEAITASTWLGCLGAFALEFFARKSALKNLFALSASVAAMIAMMFTHFMPATLPGAIENLRPALDDIWLYIHTNMIIWSYAVIAMAAILALLYLRNRLGTGDRSYSRAGGFGGMVMDGHKGFIMNDHTSAGVVLDGATMVLMEAAFVMLWAGTVMGAIWADHSWGRPWAWDPKEVYALCTFIIFLLLVHIRFMVRDKGLWTAWLALAGCAVMIFNWTVVNFVIAGLHSYA
jgi:cytochrome c-type biogenesis protein CcsB